MKNGIRMEPVTTNAEIVKRAAEQTGLPRSLVLLALEASEDVIRESIVETGEAKIPGILQVRKRYMPKRMAVDPKSGEKKEYPAVNALTTRFTMRLLQEFHNGPAHYPDEANNDSNDDWFRGVE